MTYEITFESVSDFVAETLSVEKSNLNKNTRLGEDLTVVGDDAEEFF